MSQPGPRPKLQPVRGVLLGSPLVKSGRSSPSPALGEFVEHYWWVSWDVPLPHTTHVLSHPSLHLAFESGHARAFGVVRGKFARVLQGKGRVFGIKLRPAMAGAWLALPASRWTDRSVPLADALHAAEQTECGPVSALSAAIDAEVEPVRCAELVEAWLAPGAHYPDPYATRLRDLVERVRSDPELLSVEDLARVARLPVRQLQRLFQRYVGVTPKWVVQRYRLQEAADQLERGDASIASIAARVGYFDQAHFVRDFKRIVGWTPSEHLRRAAQTKT